MDRVGGVRLALVRRAGTASIREVVAAAWHLSVPHRPPPRRLKSQGTMEKKKL